MSELRMDYDGISFEDVKQIFQHRGWIIRFFKMVYVDVSKTRKGYHVRIKIQKKLDDRDLLLLQILLGSDINREIYNFVRQQNGELLKNWNRLYDKKHIILGTKIVEDIGEEKYSESMSKEVEDEIINCVDIEGHL
jgi:hypothetical protein